MHIYTIFMYFLKIANIISKFQIGQQKQRGTKGNLINIWQSLCGKKIKWTQSLYGNIQRYILGKEEKYNIYLNILLNIKIKM